MKVVYILLIIMFLPTLYSNMYKFWNNDDLILNIDKANCMTRDSDVYIFSIKNVKLKSLNNKQKWLIEMNINLGILVECYKYSHRNIKENIKKIFLDVMEKENIIIDDNYNIYEQKPYIALLEKITDL